MQSVKHISINLTRDMVDRFLCTFQVTKRMDAMDNKNSLSVSEVSITSGIEPTISYIQSKCRLEASKLLRMV